MASKAKLLVTFLVLFLVASVVYAVTNNVRRSNLANTEFRYTGTTASYSDLTNESNWEISDGSESCNPGDALPCIVAPDMSSIASPSDLVNHLQSFSNPSDAEDFVADKTTQKRD